MNDDSAKKTILARRARFVAAAVASFGIVGGCSTKAEACLDIAVPEDSATDSLSSDADAADTQPTPCLSPAIDSGSSDVDTDAIDDSDTGPAACLKMAPDTGTDGD